MTSNSSVRILAVDDDPHLLDLYEVWLGDEYDVLLADGGTGALATLDDSVDIVLLDRHMPEMNGDEVLCEIHSRNIDVQVAMVTGVDPTGHILELGVDEYLTKPISRTDIFEVVDGLARRRDYPPDLQEFFGLISLKTALTESKELVPVETFEQLEDRLQLLREKWGRELRGWDVEELTFLCRFPPMESPEEYLQFGYAPESRCESK